MYLLNKDSNILYRIFPKSNISAFYEKAGGEDSHQKMIKWANKYLSIGSIKSLNEFIQNKEQNELLISLEILKPLINKYETYFLFSTLVVLSLDFLYLIYYPFIQFQYSFNLFLERGLLYILIIRPIIVFWARDSEIEENDILDWRLKRFLESFNNKIKKHLNGDKIIKILFLFIFIFSFYVVKIISLPYLFIVPFRISCWFSIFNLNLLPKIYFLIKNEGIKAFYSDYQRAIKSIKIPF